MKCTLMCPQVYIFGGVILPLIIGLIVIVLLKYKNNASDKQDFLNNLLFYLLLALLAYFLINWLCEKEYNSTATVVSFLPFLAYIYTGYMFVKSDDCMNAVNSLFTDCLKL
jgi:hypothetical protein